MGKTPEYIKRAAKNYRDKQYFMQVRFPRELRERLEKAGLNALEVSRLTLVELERREAEQKKET